MPLKITDQILCIPPYISTSWDQVLLIQAEEEKEGGHLLILHLIEGKTVSIPQLDAAVIDLVFEFHQKYLEKRGLSKNVLPKGGAPFLQNIGLNPEQMAAIQMKLGPMGMGFEGFEASLQHNPAQADAPDLPLEIIQKIAKIARIVTGDDLSAIAKPEPHCNCMHCQISKAIHKEGLEEKNSKEETISIEDLKFRDWDIVEKTTQLYVVTNPLPPYEEYQVFLGTPIGCTCGKPNCEHIRAVLLT